MFVSFEIVLWRGSPDRYYTTLTDSLVDAKYFIYHPPGNPGSLETNRFKPRGGWIPVNPGSLQARRILAKRRASPHWSRRSFLFSPSSFLSVFCSTYTGGGLVGRRLVRSHSWEDKGTNKGTCEETNRRMNRGANEKKQIMEGMYKETDKQTKQ